VFVLDTVSWQIEASLLGHYPAFRALAFAPEERLYGLAKDGTIHAWSLRTHALVLLRVVKGSRDSYLFNFAAPPQFELHGDGGRTHGTCAVGAFRVPLDACERRAATRGLLTKGLGQP